MSGVKIQVKLEAIGWAEGDAARRRQLAAGLTNALRGRAQKIAHEIGHEAMIGDDFNGSCCSKRSLKNIIPL